MEETYYPWGGEFTCCRSTSCVAVVLLNTSYTPPETVAIYGPLKTENIGIEKIVANVISNPYIRFLVVCGEDIRGHRSGSSLVALHAQGIDSNHRIRNAPGVIPYIENLSQEAIARFQQQIDIINLIGVTDPQKIQSHITQCLSKKPPKFGEPYIAIQITAKHKIAVSDKRAIHSRIIMNYLGVVKKRNQQKKNNLNGEQ